VLQVAGSVGGDIEGVAHAGVFARSVDTQDVSCHRVGGLSISKDGPASFRFIIDEQLNLGVACVMLPWVDTFGEPSKGRR
jgi:hypothetical protein